ncbi:Serine proteinase stubble [Nymphon striatum]|nr:Serine proteinase stubble [Nymphon striatum]
MENGCLVPNWFDGPVIPADLFHDKEDTDVDTGDQQAVDDAEYDDGSSTDSEWSDDSMKNFEKVCIVFAVVLQLINAAGVDLSSPSSETDFQNFLAGAPLFPKVEHLRAVFQQKCGVTNFRQGKVVGGSQANPGQYPWVVSIRLQANALLNPVHFCGGVIIGRKWILTAAHCIARYKSSRFTIRVGSFYRSNDNDPLLEDFKVKKIILHPSYTYPNYYNDIAIMKLDRSITYKGSHVLPICLPPHESDYVGVNAIVAGWGWLDEDRNKLMQPNTLHHVVLPVRDHATCQGFYTKRRITLLRTQLCAGFKEGGKDSCQGDSGGPLLWEENGQTYVIGIVSAGIGCARPKLPGLYTKVSHYRTWILETIDKPDKPDLPDLPDSSSS